MSHTPIDCVLPKVFEPPKQADYIRLGKSGDGGYIIDRQSIAASEKLLSFGINYDWSFESDFLRQKSIIPPLISRHRWLTVTYRHWFAMVVFLAKSAFICPCMLAIAQLIGWSIFHKRLHLLRARARLFS
jgi:hypothetical protein